jgi:phage N-6-adenine-methyltransferase
MEVGMDNKIFGSSAGVEWSTPQYLFDDLNSVFDFTLDPCATIENAKCEKFYTIKEDGLAQSWGGERVFCNPPYGRSLGPWIEKSYNEYHGEAELIVLLVPARTDVKWQHKYVLGHANYICFMRGRLKFGGSDNYALFPNEIVVYTKHLTQEQYDVLNKYGTVLKML